MVALGVVANDIGALMVGSAVGKSPLRAWVSPLSTTKRTKAREPLPHCSTSPPSLLKMR